jgi:hypothetical protein
MAILLASGRRLLSAKHADVLFAGVPRHHLPRRGRASACTALRAGGSEAAAHGVRHLCVPCPPVSHTPHARRRNTTEISEAVVRCDGLAAQLLWYRSLTAFCPDAATCSRRSLLRRSPTRASNIPRWLSTGRAWARCKRSTASGTRVWTGRARRGRRCSSLRRQWRVMARSRCAPACSPCKLPLLETRRHCAAEALSFCTTATRSALSRSPQVPHRKQGRRRLCVELGWCAVRGASRLHLKSVLLEPQARVIQRPLARVPLERRQKAGSYSSVWAWARFSIRSAVLIRGLRSSLRSLLALVALHVVILEVRIQIIPAARWRAIPRNVCVAAL